MGSQQKKKTRKLRTRLEAAGQNTLRLCGASEPLTLEAAGADGKLKRFSMVAYTGVAMNVGWGTPAVVDLAGMSIPGQARPILKDHDRTSIVGHTDEINVTQQRLKLGGVVSGVGAAAAEILQLAANGFPWQASIGTDVHSKEFVDAGKSAKVNGRNFDGPIWVVRKSTLQEVSFVPIGADSSTSASVAAGQIGAEIMNAFQKWLAAMGLVESELSDDQKAKLDAKWKAETTSPPAPAPTETKKAKTTHEIIAAQSAENDRVEAINSILARTIKERPDLTKFAGELAAAAVDGGGTVQQFELDLIRNSRANVHLLNASRPTPIDETILEAAICVHLRLPDVEKRYSEQTLDAAHRQFKFGLGIQELLMLAAERNAGYRGSRRDFHAMLRAAWSKGESIQAAGWGPSTISTPQILSNVANKFMFVGFNAIDQAWQSISATRSVNDYKQITTVGLTGDLQYAELPPGGEISHGSLGETYYNNQASIWARMIGIDERDIRNDDLGAFSSAANRLGRGGALALNNKFWTVFLNNSTFFASGNSNVVTGAGTALSGATILGALATADEKFRLQTDPDGKPLGVLPRILLVPTALRINALNGMNSTTVVGTTTANSLLPDQNVFAGAFQVVSSPYMQNSVYTGYSAAAWYLLASPTEMPVIEVAFLDGVSTPMVETADADFNMLGISMRGTLKFGVALQEYRGGVRAAGS